MEALHWIIECHLPMSLCHYLDDLLPIFKPNVPMHIANVAVIWIENIGKSLGLELDSAAMEALLPQDKLTHLCSYLLYWKSHSCCSLKDLQELIGFLQFCVQVIHHGHTFIRGLINFSMMFKSDFTRRHIPTYTHADMRWWSSYVSSLNCVQILES